MYFRLRKKVKTTHRSLLDEKGRWSRARYPEWWGTHPCREAICINSTQDVGARWPIHQCERRKVMEMRVRECQIPWKECEQKLARYCCGKASSKLGHGITIYAIPVCWWFCAKNRFMMSWRDSEGKNTHCVCHSASSFFELLSVSCCYCCALSLSTKLDVLQSKRNCVNTESWLPQQQCWHRSKRVEEGRKRVEMDLMEAPWSSYKGFPVNMLQNRLEKC